MGSARFNRATSNSRSSSYFGSPKMINPRKHRSTSSIFALTATFLILSLFLALGCVLYLLLFPTLLAEEDVTFDFIDRNSSCNLFEGNWIRDGSDPLYNSSTCPFVEGGFNCLANGRKDAEYLKWKWKPRQCQIPRFDVNKTLESLRGKRVVFVGDSMSRTQWESFICMLMAGVPDQSSVYEVNGNKISKTIRFLGVRFGSFNFTVEFFRSVFLVQPGSPPRHGPRRVKSTLKLDKMDDISAKWVDSDVLVFNSGHWWNPVKLFDLGCYFQVGGSVKLGMTIPAAFKIALETWASWVETAVDTGRTRIFFRTFEPSHWSDPLGEGCQAKREADPGPKVPNEPEFLGIINEVVARMRAPVTILNVTMMGEVRSDAHIGPWGDLRPMVDCSHWCLPGVPDAWNEIVFFLLANGRFTSLNSQS
ncbi:TRICHOME BIREFRINGENCE-LIKE 7 [Wolffia australiana]